MVSYKYNFGNSTLWYNGAYMQFIALRDKIILLLARIILQVKKLTSPLSKCVITSELPLSTHYFAEDNSRLTEQPVTPPEAGTAPEMRKSQKRIVLAEDHDDLALVMQKILESGGHHVFVVKDGRSIVQRVIELKPDILLLDIGLPNKDGYTVANALILAP